MNTKSLYNGTPTISVIDNRGLQIRTLEYNRVIDEDPIDEYITRSTYTLLGNQDSSMDPRLFSQYQNDSRTLPNMKYSNSLKGDSLCTKSIDAGQKIQFFNIEGKLTWFIDANNTQTNLQYDLIGRPTSVFEKLENEELPKCRDRFIYGEDERDAQDNNLCGKLLRHYDTAGRIQMNNFSLTGIPIDQKFQLLKNINQPSNWSSDDESIWINSLDEETYDTSWQYDAQGNRISQIDAKGNLQTFTYNTVGQPKTIRIKLNGQIEQSIVNGIEYNATGQVLRTEAGNGIVTEYIYEESTQRLTRKKDSRKISSKRREVLQDYHYEYDPVGNILSISNKVDSVRFFRNQVIVPKRQYTYDALYQLVSSSGRESDRLRQYQSFPSVIIPIPLDDSQYVNYSEKYSYDRAGNLIKLSHTGATQYTTNIDIDTASNRGILRQEDKVQNIEDYFDKAGNQKVLLPGMSMEWDTRNQLSRVNMVVREDKENDWEGYLYNSSGMRIVKQYTRKKQDITQTDTTIYLPGLELRTRQIGDNVTEVLQVVTAAQVRVLHWEEETQPDGLTNNQYRYSINDHLGSSLLELDKQGRIISKEEFYPYGGTAFWTARTKIEANYKSIRYSGKERDATGLYYYGHRYYIPWAGKWLNPDPAGTVDGLNIYRMVRNNPIKFVDERGLHPKRTDNPSKVKTITKNNLELGEVEDLKANSFEEAVTTLNKSVSDALNQLTSNPSNPNILTDYSSRLSEYTLYRHAEATTIKMFKEVDSAILSVRNNPTKLVDERGLHPKKTGDSSKVKTNTKCNLEILEIENLKSSTVTDFSVLKNENKGKSKWDFIHSNAIKIPKDIDLVKSNQKSSFEEAAITLNKSVSDALNLLASNPSDSNILTDYSSRLSEYTLYRHAEAATIKMLKEVDASIISNFK
ncbi:EscF/YscF/HrpA family type III secretion system needle major subunit [Bacillus thuringiensis]|uniref:type III secretion system needle filament subunit SctF n=1 Tax=Bacillus thuringiensis TaxID=1428 RepID=UPI000BF7CAB0|nr:type III secretion system needle filament subunit SctF [Bacillus thuringiensis]PES54781.1 EscF/YscF/HrpA family type III secretion system needle major subunit [Bacillus thuringiensis]PFB92281.1 EscF/YscF/HrpA family type III secretion system needle major subunit [Bacillus thuringiensis]PFC54271.1 EscF/YscF/HrpA family type III secretion system needle major subunit [Bacillus thuringiensis]PFD64260.1 EscF/YscF/HrpA family type III secretion system needle major subunit [Bacillus thuringiensis]